MAMSAGRIKDLKSRLPISSGI